MEQSKNKDIIVVKDLTASTTIGTNSWEQEIQQTIVINLEITTDFKKASTSDDLDHTINYHALSEEIINSIAEKRFFLLEKLAAYIENIICNYCKGKVIALTMHIEKPHAFSQVKSVGVKIVRTYS